jgi:myo-inositol-1(or 4)-monophosphatase
MRLETEAALAAAELALGLMQRREGATDLTSKGGYDLATATDTGCEDGIRSLLLGQFPDWPVVGEERGGERPADGRPYWLVDPICGTRNFASNISLYCVNIALVEDGRVNVAVVGDGSSGRCYVAERGQGAWRIDDGDRVAIRVSEAPVTVSVDDGSGSSEASALMAAIVRAISTPRQWYVRIFGSTVSFAMVADGRLSGHIVGMSSGPMHTAPGCLLAEEAGATVTGLDGEPWTVESRSLVVAASPQLNQALRTLIAEQRR